MHPLELKDVIGILQLGGTILGTTNRGHFGMSKEHPDQMADPTSADKAVELCKKKGIGGLITIGGDGTILYTLGQLPNRETPLFCVNKGTVGFMTESSTANAFATLKEILKNNCIIERSVNIASGVGSQRFEDALNEVYVVSRIPGRLLTFDVRVDGVQVDYGRADGTMVATPTGSSAYALAAGGSILTPNVHGLIFVPVCPPRFELKSLVIPDDANIELELVKVEAPGLAVIDGQTQYDVDAGEVVWIRKAEGVTRFIRLADNYYHRLNTRLVPRIQVKS